MPGTTVGGLLGDLLLGRAAGTVASWPEALSADGGAVPVISEEQARQHVSATATALKSGDVSALALIAAIDSQNDPVGIPARLELSLRALDALRRTLTAAVAEQRPDEGVHLTLQEWIPAAFAEVGRRLATYAATVLAAQLDAANVTSISVTVHELRRPLTIMSSYTQLLLAGALGELPERSLAALRTMLAASETMNRLTESLAVVARLEDPSIRPRITTVRIAEVVAAATEEVSAEAGLRNTTVDLDVDDSLSVDGDRDQLVLAVTNLLSNAVKHSPDGRPVVVRAEADNGLIRVVVRDHGDGFPEEEAERLFEKYYRAMNDREQGLPGSGLGLFIVRTVADRHGGAAVARRAPGGGAEFELSLPAA
ncbi:MAG TPA: HAMP domain-containing sensor histidine kinase [Candidatus Dormibacteraeota bacterium]|jgi:signal transduction histidine kinase|nr:HAMP domain-containing sensor histidine kinase [Candidatus Dormibacteraeota bacterium]